MPSLEVLYRVSQTEQPQVCVASYRVSEGPVIGRSFTFGKKDGAQ
jgi:hypothetical protein